jgi:hypothetical protein
MLSLSEAARVSGNRSLQSGAPLILAGCQRPGPTPATIHRVFSLGTEGRATTVSVKRNATDVERAETALLQAQIDRLFQVGELIRNELDNDRDAWRSQADRLRQLVG